MVGFPAKATRPKEAFTQHDNDSIRGQSMQFFDPFFASFDSSILTFVNASVTNLTQYASVALRTFAVIALILVGIQGLWAPFNHAIAKYFGTLLVIALISGIATVPAQYNAYLGDFLLGLPDDMFLALGATDANGNVYDSATSIGAFLDTHFERMMDGIAVIWRAGGWTNAGPALLAALLFVFMAWFGAAATVTIMIGKIGIGIMVAIGPVMILTLIHPSTRDFFFKWLSYSLHFSLLQLMIGGTLLLSDTILNTYMRALTDTAAVVPNDITSFMAPAIAMFTLAYLFSQLPSMASSIMGGIGLSSGNMAWSGPMGTPRAIKMGYEIGKEIGKSIKKAIGSGGGSVSKSGGDGGTVSRGDEPTRPRQPGGRD
jgi:type IV secretion system protein VirB6